MTTYQNLTDAGLARKRTLWGKKYAEAAGKAANNKNDYSRGWWALKRDEAEAELAKIDAVYQIRRIA